MGEWRDFFVAQGRASAALTGLIFVGISISLAELMEYRRHLLMRAATSLVLPRAVLVTSSLLLAPQQSIRTAGLEVLGVGGVSWLATMVLSVAGIRKAPPQYRHFAWIALVGTEIAAIALVIACVVLLSGGTDGLYWLLPAFTASFVVALVNGWVLLVETHREGLSAT